MTIREIFLAFAEEKEIPWGELVLEPEGENHLCIHLLGRNNRFEGHAICLEEEKLFVFYTLLGVRVPEEKREAVSAFLLRLNYQLKTGSFFIEEETGELTVRTVQYMIGADWEKQELMEQLVTDCGRTADYYYPTVMKQVFG